MWKLTETLLSGELSVVDMDTTVERNGHLKRNNYHREALQFVYLRQTRLSVEFLNVPKYSKHISGLEPGKFHVWGVVGSTTDDEPTARK